MSIPAQFLALARVFPEPLLLVCNQGQILAVNQPVSDLLSIEKETLTGKSLFEFVDFATTPRDKISQFLKNCAKSRQMVLGSLAIRGGYQYRCEGVLLQPWTEETPALVVLRLQPKESAIRQFTLLTQKIDQLAREIVERQRIEEALRERETHLRLALKAAKMGTWEVELSTGALRLSEELNRLLGLPTDLRLHSYHELQAYLHPEDKKQIDLVFEQAIDEKSEYYVEYRIIRPDSSFRWLASKGQIICDEAGQPVRAIGVALDISDRKQAEDKLRHDALHDILTGLPNRLLLMERLEQAIQRAKRRENSCFAVLFIDLDRFKLINDSLGHVVGDALLIAIANKLRRCVRASDTVARLGGDEFIIFLDELTEEKEALKIAERVIKTLKTPLIIEGREVFTTASIGIAFNTDGNESSTDILRNADLAMYSAKEQGKSCYALFNSTMHTQSQTLLELETSLRLALERQEFLVYYQPIVSLKSLTLAGFEALIRWQHPRQGLLSPMHFIPIAEETGLIVPLGEWILQEACRQLAAWQQQFPDAVKLKMSVNLSSKQLQSVNFIEQIDRILLQTGLPATCLTLEITESLLMQNTESTIITLLQLKERRIQVSLDDFGTGYSSLSYLHRLPVDNLKIDRSFTARMNELQDNLKIIEAIITLAHHLGIKVIAEGVETRQHLAQLEALRCEYAQGYLFSKPLASQFATPLIWQQKFC